MLTTSVASSDTIIHDGFTMPPAAYVEAICYDALFAWLTIRRRTLVFTAKDCIFNVFGMNVACTTLEKDSLWCFFGLLLKHFFGCLSGVFVGCFRLEVRIIVVESFRNN